MIELHILKTTVTPRALTIGTRAIRIAVLGTFFMTQTEVNHITNCIGAG